MVALRQESSKDSLLELAEACDVPVRWSCRTGVCHTCETDLMSGAVRYAPDPVDEPAEGSAAVSEKGREGDVTLSPSSISGGDDHL